MPDEKPTMIPSKDTGTVPKVKYWNNTGSQNDSNVANNLSMIPNRQPTQSDSRNRQLCSNYHCVDGLCADDIRLFTNYNSLPYINMSGGTSPSTSGSTSRRHSGGGGAIRKCDNVAKYPDRKQIEDKLNQIREYVRVTYSLVSRAKEDQTNSEESNELYQMLSALRDSEKKLEALLVVRQDCTEPEIVEPEEEIVENQIAENSITPQDADPIFPTFQNNNISQHHQQQQQQQQQRNELEDKLEISEKKLHALHEQQTYLMRLQEKAENQLKDARKAQERLAAYATTIQQFNEPTTTSAIKNTPDKNRCGSVCSDSDQLNNTDTNRTPVFKMLQEQDSELCNKQHQLNQKLHELSSKKQQIDQLMLQLENFGGTNGEFESENGDDDKARIPSRELSAMAELATLKDMLSTLQATEESLIQQNNVDRPESMERGHTPLSGPGGVKSENVTKASSVGILSDTDSRSERRWASMGKQSNKSSISSSREQLAREQAELQAKKQELEELMYKDQDQTSAINQDVCNEIVMNKGEPAFSLDSVPSSWTFLQDNTPPRESCVSRENIYSSEEEELENYSQLNNNEIKPDYVHCNFSKQIPTGNCPSGPMQDTTPSTPSVSQNMSQPWSGFDHKQQVELMTNLCQSLLEQQRQVWDTPVAPPNFQWYTSYMQMQQALMLNTISQCCQLLWIQQQDINSLINTVTIMQSTKQPPQTIPPQAPNVSVASACSLPTHLPSATPPEYPVLAARERASPQNLTRNFPVGMMGQQHHVWPGSQALNNQVPPGNRANNYWDNFRSYSRQNLLSTSTNKSNEGSQNSIPIFERSNSGQVLQPPTLPKINLPIHEGVPAVDINNHQSQYMAENVGNRTEPRAKLTKRNRAPYRNRNEWTEDLPQPETSPQKSTLFEVLRENVYEEVSSLISANQSRPHFLIQLFRDLQLIRTDPLRRNALHSIQTLITRNSDTAVSSPTVQLNPNARVGPQSQPVTKPIRNKTDKPTRKCFRPDSADSADPMNINKLDVQAQRVLIELLSLLKLYNNEYFQTGLMHMIKIMVFQIFPINEMTYRMQQKLDAIFTKAYLKYIGKRIVDIRESLLKTTADILLEEIPVQILSDRQPNISISNNSKQPLINAVNNHMKPHENHQLFQQQQPNTSFGSFAFFNQKPQTFPNANTPRGVVNGDLAEADQSTRETEVEEGAVGGVCLNMADSVPANTNADVHAELNGPQNDLDMFLSQQNNQ